MNSKLSIFAIIAVTVLVFLTGSPMAIAAPTGEIVVVLESYGHGVPLPSRETAHANDYMNLLYDPFVGTTPDGRLSTELGVAKRWEMTPDGLNWTFYLRKDVKFHDGVELTAKDVKFSIEEVMRPGSVGVHSPLLRNAIKSIEVKDPYTLIVNCRKPSIFLPNVLTGVFPDGLIQPKDSYEKIGKDEFVKHPVGSGPYKFHSQMVGSFIKLEATDRHWRDGVPRYKYVTFRIIPEESTQIGMLRTGEADIARIGRGRVQEVEKAGLNVMFKKNEALVMFWCNMQWTSPIFSDIRFRKALNLAIDREGIIKHIFAGMAKPVSTYPGSWILACGGDPNLKPYPYDPGEARRLIKEAGLEGREITVMSFSRAGFPEFPQVIETVCGHWEKIGLKPKIVSTDWYVFEQRWIAGKTEGTIAGTDNNENPSCADLVGRMEQKVHSKSSRTMLHDAKIDAMFDRASRSVDPAEVARNMVDVYRYHYDQYHYIPICQIDGVVATTQRIPKWDMGERRQERNLRDLIRER